MPRLPGYLIAFVLAMLLASTTPVGTGSGTHQFDLLHPLFSHVHLVNGRIFTHEQLAQQPVVSETYSAGPSLGAGTNTTSTEAGVGLSPVVPGDHLGNLVDTRVGYLLDEVRLPSGWLEAPPEPPPL